LEIGCGEGFSPRRVERLRKTAIDISTEALRKARSRTKAEFAAALAERLPFADKSFDLVISVGVMEHFIEDRDATREIHRYFAMTATRKLIHVELSASKRLALKSLNMSSRISIR